MESLNNFLVLFLVFNLLLTFQQFGVFSLFRVNPNLLLIGFLLFVFYRPKPSLLFLVFISFLFSSFFFAPFWVLKISILLVLVGVFALVRKFLSGDDFFDFLISVFLSVPIFYILSNLKNVATVPFGFLFKELLYNFALGIAFWLLLHKTNVFKTLQRS